MFYYIPNKNEESNATQTNFPAYIEFARIIKRPVCLICSKFGQKIDYICSLNDSTTFIIWLIRPSLAVVGQKVHSPEQASSANDSFKC